ncbi:hypothetical protein HW115_07400 [Verrucomicrobiaceae bacterium N1E253]|uniref:Peptidase C39-like domain-containing protein n=1 Tax=Oceaniferula marina TaxID=2748318 RepID=A0A851GEW3_9BACT|nr:hypothetical protein [Oceaniferula marina]NWK55432.1 hypothetical protein [Oceaniferula marina]
MAADLIGVTQKKSGKTLQVEVINLAGNQLTFKTKNGKRYTIDTKTITKDSLQNIQSHLEAQAAKSADAYGQINKAVSHPLFEGASSLWNQPAGDVAQRLKWPKESETDQSRSFRFYTHRSPDYQFLGAHPYSATLYGGEDGNTTHLSLVFANKGDFGSTAGFGEDHFKKIHPETKPPTSLKEAIETDARLISTALTQCLGDPEKQYYGEKEDRRRVLRWNMGEHAFLLSEVDEEYTSLLIVPKANADLEGKVAFVKDSDLKQIVKKNVVTQSNGDILIKNIPMVDQGPKGYCAPATFERAMRYMLVPADMYLLATAATQPGGGTNTMLLADSCKRIVRSKARRIKDLDLEKDLKIRRIKTYIDKGVPILWCMRSLDSYNQIANKRTKERAAVNDFAAWKQDISAEAESVAPSMENNESNHHICMIVGYNPETEELAVSDSWGKRYELRWIHIDIAKAVTSRGGFVIDL